MELLSTHAYTELFESEATRVLDVCAPLLAKTRRQGPHDRVPVSEEAYTANRMCRRLERRFRRFGSSLDRQQSHKVRSVARDLIYKSRADVLKAKVIESAGNSKKTWTTARQLLHSTPAPTLCDEDCATMSSTFCEFFTDKAAHIQQEITKFTRTVNQSLFQTLMLYVGSPLVAFTDVSSANVLKLLCSLPNNLLPCEILPTPLLKSCADVFASLIAHLMNHSFTEGTFSKLFKTALVLLHLLSSSNFNPLQSAYHVGHADTQLKPLF